MMNKIEATNRPTNEIYLKLSTLNHALEETENMNDRAIALIGACISEGIDTEGLIIATVSKFDLKTGHIAIMLKTEAKKAKADRLWHCDAEGRYHGKDA